MGVGGDSSFCCFQCGLYSFVGFLFLAHIFVNCPCVRRQNNYSYTDTTSQTTLIRKCRLFHNEHSGNQPPRWPLAGCVSCVVPSCPCVAPPTLCQTWSVLTVEGGRSDGVSLLRLVVSNAAALFLVTLHTLSFSDHSLWGEPVFTSSIPHVVRNSGLQSIM